MAQLIKDDDFDFELNRVLSHARYRGSDTREVLQLTSRIQPGDFDSWYNAFIELAKRAEASAGDEPTSSSQTSRSVAYVDRMFAASNYYRSADFFLHSNQKDPRIMSLWEKQAFCYNKALKYWGQGERIQLKGSGDFTIPIIYFKAHVQNGTGLTTPARTIIMGNGYDGAMEEMLHISGLAALERGYNLILYEGPGQPTVRRYQNLGFIPYWERVVTPVVDFACAQPEVDAAKISIYGSSMGGYLAVRAAAFEPRIAATIAIDGVYDMSNFAKVPRDVGIYMAKNDKPGFNQAYRDMVSNPKTATGTRWLYGHGLWAFNTEDPWEFVKALDAYTLKDVIGKVQCPVFVGRAEHDQFFEGQPEIVVEALGAKAHLRAFNDTEGADLHCQIGAFTLLNKEVFDWLDKVLG